MTPPSDNLPARAEFGPSGVPLSDAPTAALAFALGYAVARPQHANQFGPFCAMVEELMARESGSDDPGPIGRYDQRKVFGTLMNLLPTDLSRSIAMLYQVQRGQRWARTGQYRPPSGNSGLQG